MHTDELSKWPDVPVCWRCRAHPGLVSDGTVHECIECAGKTMRRTRETLDKIHEVVAEDLPIVPRMMDRVEFVSWCIDEHKRRATEDKAWVQCGAFDTATGEVCLLETDHRGQHILPSMLADSERYRVLRDVALRGQKRGDLEWLQPFEFWEKRGVTYPGPDDLDAAVDALRNRGTGHEPWCPALQAWDIPGACQCGRMSEGRDSVRGYDPNILDWEDDDAE